MKNAAVGLRPHSGWTALVAVAVEKGGPVVLCRDRVHLVKTFNYSFRQPYHTAAKAPIVEGRAFIAQVRAEARSLAYRALRRVQSNLQETDYRLTRCGLLLASGRPLPNLEEILAAHPLIHTADGELFREALAHASGRCGLGQFQLKEKELLARASKVLGRGEKPLLRQVTKMGKPMGSPWAQDEKFAALVAWLALAGKKGNRKGQKAKRA